MQEYIKKILGSGHRHSSSASHNNITLIISNDEINDIIKIVIVLDIIDFMLAGKKLTVYTNLCFPYGFKKNDNIILNYFKYE